MSTYSTQPTTADAVVEETVSVTSSTAPKKRRWRSGTVAKREIRKLSRTTQLLMPKATFQRLVREITQDLNPDLRWKADALQAIQEAAENYITEGFMRANSAREFSGRKTLSVKDVRYSGDGNDGSAVTTPDC